MLPRSYDSQGECTASLGVQLCVPTHVDGAVFVNRRLHDEKTEKVCILLQCMYPFRRWVVYDSRPVLQWDLSLRVCRLVQPRHRLCCCVRGSQCDDIDIRLMIGHVGSGRVSEDVCGDSIVCRGCVRSRCIRVPCCITTNTRIGDLHGSTL